MPQNKTHKIKETQKLNPTIAKSMIINLCDAVKNSSRFELSRVCGALQKYFISTLKRATETFAIINEEYKYIIEAVVELVVVVETQVGRQP